MITSGGQQPLINRGRAKITTSETNLTSVPTICNIINSAMTIHENNSYAENYLINYYLGKQPILDLEKTIRPEINNKIVVNLPQMIVRMVTGYFLGTPIQYSQRKNKHKKEIDLLNDYLDYEDKSSLDKEIGDFQSICGTAYKLIYSDGLSNDEVPFEQRTLDPRNTFVVYSQSVTGNPVMGVTYHSILDENGNISGSMVYVYTETGYYRFKTLSAVGVYIQETDLVESKEIAVGGIPIIEYPNNMWRLGDFEVALDLLDAINKFESNRLNDIDQFVQSLVYFINADIDSATYDEMRECGVVCLKNTTNAKSEIGILNSSLDQTSLQQYGDDLKAYLYAIVGIPDRDRRSGGGGDTGQAVELRDGWADLEIVARNKEMTYKKSEKQSLKIILNILKSNNELKNLSLVDIDIKFSRNKNNNLLVKTQAGQTLNSMKMFAPEDVVIAMDLFGDVNEVVSKGKAFWGEEYSGKVPMQDVQPEPAVPKPKNNNMDNKNV